MEKKKKKTYKLGKRSTNRTSIAEQARVIMQSKTDNSKVINTYTCLCKKTNSLDFARSYKSMYDRELEKFGLTKKDTGGFPILTDQTTSRKIGGVGKRTKKVEERKIGVFLPKKKEVEKNILRKTLTRLKSFLWK